MSAVGSKKKKLIVISIILAVAACGLIAAAVWGLNRNSKPASANSVGEVSVGSQTVSSEDVSQPEPSSAEESAEASQPAAQAAYPAEWEDHGLFREYYPQAYAMLQQMTLEEKVGQMVLARCPETDQAAVAEQYHLGGYVLFGRDFKGKTEQQVKDAIASYQQASKIPMAIAVDEEGGSVVRISSNPNLCPSKFASQQSIYRNGGLEAIAADTQNKVQVLKNLGINVNLAPVSDVSQNTNDYIYGRTFGVDAQTTAQGIKTIVQNMQGSGVSATLKHFPGYGNNVDTHTGIAIDERSMDSFVNNDFLPFQAGGNAGAECVLVSHNVVKCMDSQYPASISPKVHEVLTKQLGFTGIVMTDDMAMDAITEYAGNENPYVLAVRAGNNLITTTDYAATYQSVLDAANSGGLEQAQIDFAVFRILAWKYYEGLIQ